MPRSVRCVRFGVVILLAAGLAACSTFNMGTTSTPRPLDVLNDDIASLVLAIDVSPKLRVLAQASAIQYDVVDPDAEDRHVTAELRYVEADDLPPNLPAPEVDRAYFLFAAAESDRANILGTQVYARQLHAAGKGTVTVSVLPGFCAAETLDVAEEVFTIRLSLEGAGSLYPLVIDRPLSDFLAESGIVELPTCEGF